METKYKKIPDTFKHNRTYNFTSDTLHGLKWSAWGPLLFVTHDVKSGISLFAGSLS